MSSRDNQRKICDDVRLLLALHFCQLAGKQCKDVAAYYSLVCFDDVIHISCKAPNTASHEQRMSLSALVPLRSPTVL
jgi:hypothetical protein